MKIIHIIRILSAAFLAGASLAGPAHAYDPARVLNVMKHPRLFPNHTVIISHRGIVSSGCPENSACSIAKASNINVEAIELDVKRSRSGTLWLMHDQNLGRMTEPNFNMYKKTGPNPDISSLTDRQIAGRVLKDRGFFRTNYRILRLDEALNLTKGMVVVLDLKTVRDTELAVAVINRMGAGNRVILKVNAAWFPVYYSLKSVISVSRGLPVALAIYANAIDPINRAWANARSPYTAQGNLRGYAFAVMADPTAIFLEIGNKQQVSSDPLYSLVKDSAGGRVPTSQFIPYPEYPISGTGGIDLQYGYVKSDSSCCADLSAYLTKTQFYGNETSDQRPSLMSNGGWKSFNSILTDNVSTVANQLARNGSRRTSYYSSAGRNWKY